MLNIKKTIIVRSSISDYKRKLDTRYNKESIVEFPFRQIDFNVLKVKVKVEIDGDTLQ